MRNNIINESNKYYKFNFENGHTFKELKEKKIYELDYNKAYDLAVVENKMLSISAYLGVYDNEFGLTYSIHSSKNYDVDFENVLYEKIDIEKIKTKNELKKIMIEKSKCFYNENREMIELLSKELDIQYQEYEENQEL
ncbi:MAG: hypothetical protein Q4G09_00280 [Clostridia bacterium]|nr:hypothetical protein [Clostridia bacterium]